MRTAGDSLLLSPTDLSTFLACRHRTGLDLAVALGHLAKPERVDPVADALRTRGEEHERRYVDALRARAPAVVEIPRSGDMAAETMAAMRAGADAIVQARLEAEGIGGYADVLIRVDRPSALGAWSYEAQDTKLARETKGGTILQLCAYSVMLGRMQDAMPERFHVVMPGPARGAAAGGGPQLVLFPPPAFIIEAFRLDDYTAYYRMILRSLLAAIEPGPEALIASVYPEPVPHCDVCRWEARCHARRRRDDHLSFVADLSRLHRRELEERGIATLDALASMALPPPFKPSRGSARTYERAHHQARVQREQRRRGAPVHELLPLEEGRGLQRLPAPSEGDVFLDLEGASFARDGGREFVFGAGLARRSSTDHERAKAAGAGEGFAYRARWAVNDQEEKRAFEEVVDDITRTLGEHPDMHVYHFSPYEPAALKRLMGRYASREDEIDRLLRGERFVDLHAILRHTLRAGVESYSLKQMEPFYGFARSVALADAGAALLQAERFMELNQAGEITPAMRALIEGYNQDDCRSAQALREWLERLRAEVEASGTPVPRPVPQDDEPSEDLAKLQLRTELLREQLMAGLPADRADDTATQAPRRLLANLLDWHRRENKVQWWEYFRLRDLPEEELFDERKAIAGLTPDGHVSDVVSRKTGRATGSLIVRYRYPPQEMEIDREDEVKLKDGSKLGDVVAVDRAARTIDIKQGPKMIAVRPTAIFEHRHFSPKAMQESMLRLAEGMLDGSPASRCGLSLLHGEPPRLAGHVFDARGGESPLERAVRVVRALDGSTLAIQGPPGAGKTYTGAEMICALVREGRRVGVTAVSHRVIRNLLDAVRDRAAGLKQTVAAGHKVKSEDDVDEASPVKEFGSNKDALDALARGDVQLLGATPWLWAREEAAGRIDVLVVDEAGQMSLANVLAASRCARSLVLLGDPQQLDQPQKGSHPDGADVSALEHVLGGHQTMPDAMGMFLPITWRLAPAVCRFTSDVFYEGRLAAKAGLERQRLDGCGAFDGAGVWSVTIDHDGNRNWSQEEIDEVTRIVGALLVPGARWTDERGETHAMRGEDILVVAPYNAQVNRLDEALAPRGVRVGTVDRFQGQEAPVVIYSMATSRPEDAPRGMEFLYSLNRLNVATSRARCAAIIVSSPRLLEPECRTPRQMQLANALCRFRELARVRGL